MAGTRGWRLTPAAAWQVVAHATVGWIVMGFTSWLGLLFLPVLLPLSESVGGTLGSAISGAGPLAGALLGLLVFELLVWHGVRECRFANPPAPARATAH